MWVRRDGLSFYLGTCPALSEAGLPSSSPSGCRLFSRWFHRAHPPSPGPLREKAAFCTDPGWGWQILVIWNLAPNVQTLVPLSGDREGPQNHSLWELGGSPETAAIPLGPSSLERASRRRGDRELQAPSGAGQARLQVPTPSCPAPAGAAVGTVKPGQRGSV